MCCNVNKSKSKKKKFKLKYYLNWKKLTSFVGRKVLGLREIGKVENRDALIRNFRADRDHGKQIWPIS